MQYDGSGHLHKLKETYTLFKGTYEEVKLKQKARG